MREVSFNELAKAMMLLSKEEQLAIVARPERLKEFAAELAIQIVKENFFVPLPDGYLVERFLGNTTAGWRALATELGHDGPVAWLVKEGFTLKEHAPKAGPCYKNFRDPEPLHIQNDGPTKASLVFWIPRLVPGSGGKTAQEQIMILTELRQRHSLPANHLDSLGNATLLAGLILVHFNCTDEMVAGVKTDSLCSDGLRICFVVYNNQLFCVPFSDDYSFPDIGCFPLGVEKWS